MKNFAAFLFLGAALATAQTDNTFYARQYAGPDVGTKVAAAQGSCSTHLPCYIVIDSSLAAWATGTMPAKCSTCTWVDYRTGNPWSGVLSQSTNVDSFASTGNGTTGNCWSGWESGLMAAPAYQSYYFRAGCYNQSQTVNLGSMGQAGMVITGAGSALVTINATAAMPYMIRTDGVNLVNLQISGLTLNGGFKAPTSSTPAVFEAVTGLWINRTGYPFSTVKDINVNHTSGTGIIIQNCQMCSASGLYSNYNLGKGIVFLGDNGLTAHGTVSQYNGLAYQTTYGGAWTYPYGNGIEIHACTALDWGSTYQTCVPYMQLAVAANSSQTTLTVTDASYAQVGQIYTLGQCPQCGTTTGQTSLQEFVHVTAVTNTGTATQPVWVLTVTRGYQSTTAVSQTVGTMLLAENSATNTAPYSFALPFGGGLTLTGSTVSEDNGGHALWVNSVSPSAVDLLWAEQVPNYFDALRFTGPGTSILSGRVDGTANQANTNAAVHLLPGSNGTHVRGLFWEQDAGAYWTQNLVDPSVTNYAVEAFLYPGTNMTQAWGPGTSANPAESWGGCGVYNNAGTIAFSCPLSSGAGAVAALLCRAVTSAGTPLVSTGNTSANLIATCPIATGMTGVNSTLSIQVQMGACTGVGAPWASCTAANTGTCALGAYLSPTSGSGGSNISQGSALVAAKEGVWEGKVSNAGSQSAQTVDMTELSGSNTVTLYRGALALNSASNLYLNLFLTNSVSADRCFIDQYSVTLQP